MSAVAAACERLMDAAQGKSGLLVLHTEPVGELAEHVLIRREDLELLLATWGAKHADATH